MVVAMSSGDGYDKGSSNQAAANKGAVEWLKKGKNSALELRVVVDTILGSKAYNGEGIIVTHVDTTANDWNQLCRNITHTDSYQSASDGIYSHFMARSFYEQVAPASTVALAYSGISFHWMSKFFFGVAPGLINAHLTQRSQAEKDRILDVMRAHYIGLVSANPIELKFPFVLIVLRRK
ncbi:hypothetical protein WJX84_007354 [Apatococcus fuscideae]|uniref:Uncharacterized protein n=1 Tax=Apatococcus fuscideae TaxID=2026836 RepID=A0AAW1TAY0_9CHLO